MYNIGDSRQVLIFDSNVKYEVPSLHLLLNLDGLNILQEVGSSYFMFGVIILNEESGVIIKTIESDCNHKSQCSNRAIAERWLSGHRNYKETTWTALVETLCEIERRTLAIKVKDTLETHNIHVKSDSCG